MAPFVLYVLACLLPAIAAKKTAMSKHQLELKEHYDHLAKVAEFECDLPQPRLLEVGELLPEVQMRGKAYFPGVTVLHRCDRHTGACSDAAHRCGPSLTTSVNMPFKVTFLEATDARAQGEWEMEYHLLENHTACGCLKYEAPPSKTAVHYHYIDPSLMPQGVLPLDPDQRVRQNVSSYDVPVYNSSVGEGPSIFDITKMAEKTGEGQYSGYGGYGDTSSTTQDEYPGYPSSSSTSSNGEYPSPSTTSSCDGCDDGEATTISEDLVRFGSGHSDAPRTGALKSAVPALSDDSPYDALLKDSS